MAVLKFSSTVGKMLAIAANIKTIRIGDVILLASLKLFAKMQMQRLTADANIEKIIFEEIEPYYAGEKSLDDCISVMNNRAQLVLNERS